MLEGNDDLQAALGDLDAQLADKATKSEVLALVGDVSDGTPLFAPNTAGMTNTTRNYVNTTDGLLYTHNGTAWVSTGVTYQATGIADGSVTTSKIAKQTRETVEFTANRINETMTRELSNKFSDVANIVVANATATVTTPTGVVPNDGGRNLQVAFTSAATSHFSVQNIQLTDAPPTLGLWMKKSELLAAESVLEIYPTIWFQNSGGATILNITLDGNVASGTPKVKANDLTKVGTKYSFVKEGVTLTFESLSEFGDYIYWVAYTDIVFPASTQCRFFITVARKTQAITLNFFDPFWSKTKYKLVPRFKSQQTTPALIPYPINKYQDKRLVTLGDSITWQDAKTYSYNGLVARGYQTIIKEKLGFLEVLNMGVSGRPMANGTANGVGTNTTGKTVTYTTYDLTTIAAGTNDFKLNVQLGTLGAIGDTTFDTNTFYGAYRDLIEYILTQKPTQKIILFTPLQRDNGGYTVNTSNTAGHKLIDYVNAIKAVGQMYSLPVVDMYAESGITKLNLATYTWDGLHPNDAGYARMAELAIGALITK